MLLSLITAAAVLHASVYESNALMQPLSLLDDIPAEGYYIIEEGNVSTLYSDGTAVKTVIREDDRETVTTQDETVIRYFDDGILKEESMIRDGIQTDIKYEYSGTGTLKRVIYSSDDVVTRVVQYNYSPVAGLSAVMDASLDSVNLYSGSSVSYRLGDETRVSDGALMILSLKSGADITDEMSVVYDEAGGFSVSQTLEEGVRQTFFDSSLAVLCEKLTDSSGNAISENIYTYDDNGEVTLIRERSGDISIDYYYEDGRVMEKVESLASQVHNRTVYLEDGTSVNIRYRGGQPYARVHYDKDGRRVLSLEMI